MLIVSLLKNWSLVPEVKWAYSLMSFSPEINCTYDDGYVLPWGPVSSERLRSPTLPERGREEIGRTRIAACCCHECQFRICEHVSIIRWWVGLKLFTLCSLDLDYFWAKSDWLSIRLFKERSTKEQNQIDVLILGLGLSNVSRRNQPTSYRRPRLCLFSSEGMKFPALAPVKRYNWGADSTRTLISPGRNILWLASHIEKPTFKKSSLVKLYFFFLIHGFTIFRQGIFCPYIPSRIELILSREREAERTHIVYFFSIRLMNSVLVVSLNPPKNRSAHALIVLTVSFPLLPSRPVVESAYQRRNLLTISWLECKQPRAVFVILKSILWVCHEARRKLALSLSGMPPPHKSPNLLNLEIQAILMYLFGLEKRFIFVSNSLFVAVSSGDIAILFPLETAPFFGFLIAPGKKTFRPIIRYFGQFQRWKASLGGRYKLIQAM